MFQEIGSPTRFSLKSKARMLVRQLQEYTMLSRLRSYQIGLLVLLEEILVAHLEKEKEASFELVQSRSVMRGLFQLCWLESSQRLPYIHPRLFIKFASRTSLASTQELCGCISTSTSSL